MQAIARFVTKVQSSSNGCHVWTGALDGKGYGCFWDGTYLPSGHGRYVRAHRWAYAHHRGLIGDGLQIDHLCRNRACVNPEHLEPVTCRENLLRGHTLAAALAKQTHCKRGHLFDQQNTILHRNSRSCRQCKRAAERLRYHSKKDIA